MSKELANSHVAELGSSIGLDLEFNEDNICAFDYGENGEHTIMLYYIVQTDSLLAVSPILRVPENAGASFFKQVLKTAIRAATVVGGSLGLNEDENLVVYTSHFEVAESSLRSFEAFMEKVTDAIDDLKTAFEKLDAGEEETYEPIFGEFQGIRI